MSALSACERRRYDECQRAIGAIRTELNAAPEGAGEGAASEALATARIALASYAAWQDETMIPGYARSFEARDVGMASVFMQLRELHFPGRKALIWAQNIHVVKNDESVSESWVGGPIVTQGTALDRELGGDRYRAVAMIGFDVWLNRPEQRGRASPRPSPGSLEVVLHAVGGPGFFVDLRHPEAAAVLPVDEVWSSAPQTSRPTRRTTTTTPSCISTALPWRGDFRHRVKWMRERNGWFYLVLWRRVTPLTSAAVHVAPRVARCA